MKHIKKILTLFTITCMMGTMIVGCSNAPKETGKMENTEKSVEDNNEEDSTTSDKKEEDTVKVPEDMEVAAGKEMSSASSIPLETKVSGTAESGATAWYSFTTSDAETYKIMSENVTDGDETTMEVVVYDEYGTKLVGDKNYIKNNGKPGVATLEKADANTTYYIGINVETFVDDCDYNIIVKAVKE